MFNLLLVLVPRQHASRYRGRGIGVDAESQALNTNIKLLACVPRGEVIRLRVHKEKRLSELAFQQPLAAWQAIPCSNRILPCRPSSFNNMDKEFDGKAWCLHEYDSQNAL